jgi:hypothetical protein
MSEYTIETRDAPSSSVDELTRTVERIRAGEEAALAEAAAWLNDNARPSRPFNAEDVRVMAEGERFESPYTPNAICFRLGEKIVVIQVKRGVANDES